MSVQSEITRLANAKTALATSIEGKGVTVPEGTKLDGMAALVEAIEGGGGNSVVNDINLAGVNFTIKIDNASCNDWTLKDGEVFINTPNATPSLTFYNCLFERCDIYCKQAVKDAIVNGENYVANCAWYVN